MTAAFASPPRRCAAALAALLALWLLAAPSIAFAGETDDPNLNQTLDELAIVHGDRVLQAGHIDMGPKYDDGAWRFLIHDDVAKADANATSVWRYPDETVFHVLDAAKLTVPDDPAYEFLGAEPGSDVYVVPQTQNPEVVWVGWNTQDPQVMETIDRGITLSLDGVQGPGIMTTYLQSGSFGEPQLL
ncbi:MAG: choice-of-anchor M domain-containing protein, partial [Bifidobacteriaceae bacterium]|nr:choice-of-anchor M domain-containing protein [Bifidobacteriaceae bacterium]